MRNLSTRRARHTVLILKPIYSPKGRPARADTDMSKNQYNNGNGDEKRPSFFERIRREREEISPDEPKILDKPNIPNFFKLLGRKINTLLTVNLMYVFGNFPIFFVLFAISGYPSMESFAPPFQQYAPLLGASYFDPSPVMAALLGVFGVQTGITVPTTLTYILFAMGLLILFTFGPVNVGTTYILRSMIREEGLFLWSDFWYAIKRNVRQEFVFGILDLVIMGLLGYDFIYFYLNLNGTFMLNVMFFLTFAMCIVYLIMRMYIYLMMITFDLSIFKLLKNALFFSILGIKRNIMALLGLIVILAIEYTLMSVFFPLAVILPFILLFSVGGLLCAYAAYPKIKEIMIDPYYKESDSYSDLNEE